MAGQHEDSGTIDVSERLRELMTVRQLTVAQLAAAAGVSKSAMEKYLAGPCSPRATAISAICRNLDVSANWLFFGHFDAEGYRVRRDADYVIVGLLEDLKKPGPLNDQFNSLEFGTEDWRLFARELADLRAIEIVKHVRESELEAFRASMRGGRVVTLGPYPLVFGHSTKHNDQGSD